MQTFANNFGALLLGIFLNTYLYGIVSFQYGSYFTTKFGDPLWINVPLLTRHIPQLFLDLRRMVLFVRSTSSIVSWTFVLRGVATISVESYGNYLALLAQIWPYRTSIFLTSITALLNHSFLAYRVYRLTNIWVYAGLLVLTAATFASGIAFGVKTCTSVRGIADMSVIKPFMISWLSTQLAVDVVLSGILLFYLARARTGFQRSDTVINRLMRTCIQAGFFSGVFSMMCLAFFIARPDTQYFSLFGLSISRVYTNTLMDTLLCREALRGIFQQQESVGYISSLNLRVRKETRTEISHDEALTSKHSGNHSGKYSTTLDIS
ncbi:hypothetical protein B0H34DRAFT_797654 [Crassisporium funariophilum]|nr:hypothetical protein B0H34DRAFT_797654 [Crassisporium funariophilum]